MIAIPIAITTQQHRRARVSGSWWELLSGAAGAWEAALAADKATSLVNLLNPGTYNLTEINGTVTWSAGVGWGGFSPGFLYTGITIPGGLMVQFAGITNSTHRCAMGCTAPLSGNTAYSILPVWHSPTTDRAYETQVGESSPAGQQSTATMALSAGQPYLNGVADGSAISLGTPATSPVGLGAGVRRTDPQGGWAADGFCDGAILRAIVWTDPPAAGEILSVHEMWAGL